MLVAGGGLAGLSAAHSLTQRGKSVLILEARERCGGKVVTCLREEMSYEMGALFAFQKEWLPFPVEAGRKIINSDPVALFTENRVIRGKSVPQLLQEAGTPLRDQLALKRLLSFESLQKESFEGDTLEILNAFFNVIHPGPLNRYIPGRRPDSLVVHDASWFEKGNQCMTDSFLNNTLASVLTGSRVTAAIPMESGNEVHWEDGEKSYKAFFDWVVIALPAPEAKKILQPSESASLNSSSSHFLERIEYRPGITVVMATQERLIERFSYIVSTDGYINTFFSRRSPEKPDVTVITAYIVGDKAEQWNNKRDADILAMAVAEFNRLDIGSINQGTLLFSDIYRWDGVGPVISKDVYGFFSNTFLYPGDRMVLAGDYTFWNNLQMPYGMFAAIESGKKAAAIICDSPEYVVSTPFTPEPLARTTITSLTDHGPGFVGSVQDGTIAYYGLLITAEPDNAIKRYLIGESENSLWSYQQGYGVTSLDTAIVLEGLLASGCSRTLLEKSADQLVKVFYDDNEGGFFTIPEARKVRAPYWRGTDCCATAFCAWLLREIAPEKYGAVIQKCALYLRKRQLITGCWPGKWFPSMTIPLYYAVRLLSQLGSEYEPSCNRAGTWLLGGQDESGSWINSVIESSAALLALSSLKNNLNLSRYCQHIHMGGEWLKGRSRKITPLPGEPILCYEIHENGDKFLYHSIDNGKITAAWATMALKALKEVEPSGASIF